MNPYATLAIAAVAGYLLGVMFFGGLWWTIQRLATARHPGLIMTASLVLRMGLLLGGFYFVLGDDWLRLLACLVGLLIARRQWMHHVRQTMEASAG